MAISLPTIAWNRILPAVAQFAAVVAYDRAGDWTVGVGLAAAYSSARGRSTAATVGEPGRCSALPFDTKKYVDAMQQNRLSRLRSWVRGQGEFIVAPNAGHFVHADAPELVIAAIRRLVRR